mgnify:CR=1 FL=1
MEGNGGFPEYFKVNTQRNVHFLHFFRKERYSASGQTKIKSQIKNITDRKFIFLIK